MSGRFLLERELDPPFKLNIKPLHPIKLSPRVPLPLPNFSELTRKPGVIPGTLEGRDLAPLLSIGSGRMLGSSQQTHELRGLTDIEGVGDPAMALPGITKSL